MTFGCRPSDGVPAKSTIAKAYFRYLKKAAQPTQDGSANIVVLPGCLNFFQNTDGKCEHNVKTAKPVMIEWSEKPVKTY
jgi:hypothetical protein